MKAAGDTSVLIELKKIMCEIILGCRKAIWNPNWLKLESKVSNNVDNELIKQKSSFILVRMGGYFYVCDYEHSIQFLSVLVSNCSSATHYKSQRVSWFYMISSCSVDICSAFIHNNKSYSDIIIVMFLQYLIFSENYKPDYKLLSMPISICA